MTTSFEKLLEQYNYKLPEELIAQEPASPRDSASLLVYDRENNKVRFDTYANLGKYLPKNAVLVFNQTKVVPARLAVTKETGGKAKLLFISREGNEIKVIANRKFLPGSMLRLTSKIHFTVSKQHEQFYFLKPNFSADKIKNILQKYGHTPLPPYIKHSKLTEKRRREEYQTVFAKDGLSVAAPTASLHFTKQLIAKLKKQGVAVHYVTLNVNLGTFAPLKEEQVKNKALHIESYEIKKSTAEFLNKAKAEGRTIVAVGTTVVRTLESSSRDGKILALKGDTSLFISEGYKLQFVDSLITNFHVPKSSLLMLVSAFTGRKKLMNLYQKAIAKRMRFFSFGDGMLIF